MSMARFYLTFICVIFVHLNTNTNGIPIPDENDTLHIKASQFLEHNGYLKTHLKLRKDDSNLTTEEFRNAIKTFQNYTHLKITGDLDDATIDQMRRPRCGLPDFNPESAPESARKKRYAVHTYKWAIQDLTFKIYKYSSQLSVNETNIAIQRALQLWSSAAQINFHNASSSPLSPVNIAIGFYTNSHGDNDPFDGPGATLAHAFFPPYGDLHFDDAENFTLNSINGTNFLSVATHELGHSLGLEHSFVPGAVMFPYYQPYDPHAKYKLHSDDIAGIQFLYGARGESPTYNQDYTTPSGFPAWRYPGRDICQAESIDAIYHDTEKDLTTIFKGAQYWVMDYYGVKQGYPKLIKLTWPPFPTDIDATLYWPANAKLAYPSTVFIFKDTTVYTMMNNMVITAAPISRVFPGLPDFIDSAVAVTKDNVTYFTKGYQLFYCNMYEMHSIKEASPAVLRWFLNYVNGAVNYKDHMYLFVSGVYYAYDNNGKILQGYPKSIATDWHGCTGNIPREEERDRKSAANRISFKLPCIIMILLLYVQSWL